ncbi:Acetyl xylan esterase (AXE1) [Planctomycetes bacterium K23_9]|uniref:Acetyl xylan esterase (AXE1) n=2 Tax=Stieleria marina TaxID=1930275 RepID=A0A517NPU1_9BACT|nr:Acetyl xylan esterase (AXE1) [Planctomycetes bacterium K23_9]
MLTVGFVSAVLCTDLTAQEAAKSDADQSSLASSLRVLPADTVPDDKRLGELKTLNGHFPFKVPDNPGQWYARADELRQRVLIANGLWPMPAKTPLQAVLHGKVKRPGFTVERVYFQSLPGHYVTGLLFRPQMPSADPRPGVLSPHGHGGRQMQLSDEAIQQQLQIGGEHFAASGSMPKLARCAQLARMGCVTFIFDMLGYEDSIQIEFEAAHRHASARPNEARSEGAGDWVFFSPDADLHLQSIMGLQTWNAIRALDFLASLPDVDADRLAVTGGSGGGTQSILLGAIDDRIKVSFPNGMVSTSMQGGCYCENCNFLRVGTGNVELAALFAPKPQAMTAADDWTRDMMKDGYPELRWLYAMLGNEEDVYCREMLHFKHNYNYVTRATMYHWMNRHLKLGLDDPVIESDYKPLAKAETTVWTDVHAAPLKKGPEHEREVCRWLYEQAQAEIRKWEPTKIRDTALPTLFGVDRPPMRLGFAGNDELKFQSVGKANIDSLVVERGLLSNSNRGSKLPMLVVRGNNSAAKRVVVWTHGRGKNAAFDEAGKPSTTLKTLCETATVLLPDLLGQGEFNASEDSVTHQRLIDDKRSYSAFTFGYNRTLVSQRVNDLFDVIGFAHQTKGASVRLMASGGAVPWAAAAAAFLSDQQLSKTLFDTQDFRFGDVQTYRDANFVPGSVKYGDLPVLLELCPGELRTEKDDSSTDFDSADNLKWLAS